jgi:hypothetical protein
VPRAAGSLKVAKGHKIAALSLNNTKKNVKSGIVHRYLKNNVYSPTKTRYDKKKPLVEV